MNRALYVFAGGGTGGHLAPGIAVAEELLRREPTSRIRFAGSGRAIEDQMLAPTGFERSTHSAPPLGQLKRRPISFLWSHWQAYRQARSELRRDRPQAVVGLGGFASVPCVLAARRERVPVILLEQNAVTGRANRWLARRSPILLTFEESAASLPAAAEWEVTGNPMRRALVERAQQRRLSGCEPGGPATLLVLGGSQGSRQVNESVLKAVSQLSAELAGWRIVHQTGSDGEAAARETYSRIGIAHQVQSFFDEPGSLYETATLAVSRSGATTLTELAAFGVPAVLIPYPLAADNHQVLNARPFVAAEAAIVVEESRAGMEAVELVSPLGPLLGNRARLAEMSSAMAKLGTLEAAVRVADWVEQIAPLPPLDA